MDDEQRFPRTTEHHGECASGNADSHHKTVIHCGSKRLALPLRLERHVLTGTDGGLACGLG